MCVHMQEQVHTCVPIQSPRSCSVILTVFSSDKSLTEPEVQCGGWPASSSDLLSPSIHSPAVLDVCSCAHLLMRVLGRQTQVLMPMHKHSYLLKQATVEDASSKEINFSID